MNDKYIITVYDEPKVIAGELFDVFITRKSTDYLSKARDYKRELERLYPGKEIRVKRGYKEGYKLIKI